VSSTSRPRTEPILVIGASGFVGRHLCSYFERKGQLTVGTYASTPAVGLQQFDMREHRIATLVMSLPVRPRFAVIAAAETKMDRCHLEWAATYSVNVEATLRVTSDLQDLGVTPVFISSDYVYDGLTGDYGDDAARNPVLDYGRQKVTVEDGLIHSGRPYIVVRAARIYGLNRSQPSLLTTIAADLAGGATLRMATDQLFTPCFVDDLSAAIDILMRRSSFGCHNLGPSGAVSRYEVARQVQERLRIRSGDVVPCRLQDLQFCDARPANTSLDSHRFVEATGFRFLTIEQSLERLASSLDLNQSN